MREGDTIYIKDFSRLARSTKDLLEIVETLEKKGIKLISLKENLDTSTATGKLMLTMISAICFPPYQNDKAHEAISLLFLPAPRLLIASLIAFVISQLLNIRIFSKLANIFNERMLWLRSNVALMVSELVDNINNLMGNGTIIYARQGVKREWKTRADKKSPRYTTNWEELPEVKAIFTNTK